MSVLGFDQNSLIVMDSRVIYIYLIFSAIKGKYMTVLLVAGFYCSEYVAQPSIQTFRLTFSTFKLYFVYSLLIVKLLSQLSSPFGQSESTAISWCALYAFGVVFS